MEEYITKRYPYLVLLRNGRYCFVELRQSQRLLARSGGAEGNRCTVTFEYQARTYIISVVATTIDNVSIVQR